MAYFFALSRARFLTKIKPNSAHIFPCYCIKQLDSMLPCVCSVIHHRRRQNVVRTSVTHSATPRENEVRERIPHTCPSSYENFFNLFLFLRHAALLF